MSGGNSLLSFTRSCYFILNLKNNNKKNFNDLVFTQWFTAHSLPCSSGIIFYIVRRLIQRQVKEWGAAPFFSIFPRYQVFVFLFLISTLLESKTQQLCWAKENIGLNVMKMKKGKWLVCWQKSKGLVNTIGAANWGPGALAEGRVKATLNSPKSGK